MGSPGAIPCAAQRVKTPICVSQWPECAAFNHFKSLALEPFCLRFVLVCAKGCKGAGCLDVLIRLSWDKRSLSQKKFMAWKEGHTLELGRSPLIEGNWTPRGFSKSYIKVVTGNSKSYANSLSPNLLIFFPVKTKWQIGKLYGENDNCTFHWISYLLKTLFTVLKNPTLFFKELYFLVAHGCL